MKRNLSEIDSQRLTYIKCSAWLIAEITKVTNKKKKNLQKAIK